MTGKTHLIAGVTMASTIAHYTNYEPLALIISGAVGSLLPDICHGGSKIGRRFPLLSTIINTLFGHRTFTHSLLFLFIIAFVMNRFVPVEALTVGLLAGMISHLILDAFTRRGIRFFYPLKLTVRFPLTIKTGSAIENLIFTGLTIIFFYFLIHIVWVY
ncbi:metal-dependent hydrolase [Alkalihalobacillus trypoxylicola]|uniref:Hydrolase n=1 Tax=Alkalihalobacillus trypoxylicola TaxID=519424 RepID=A0A161Q9U8_9BACI|nr:metal-dependent hydrolase [Alkalihalobacillus trypoxylicola]KYG34159.1 hypothetical protein AZF04_15135 [Alkalihalobacillus trypoxylicola]